MFSPATCAAGVATLMTDGLALAMRFCVQLLFERGATTPSSLNTVKITNARRLVRIHAAPGAEEGAFQHCGGSRRGVP